MHFSMNILVAFYPLWVRLDFSAWNRFNIDFSVKTLVGVLSTLSQTWFFCSESISKSILVEKIKVAFYPLRHFCLESISKSILVDFVHWRFIHSWKNCLESISKSILVENLKYIKSHWFFSVNFESFFDAKRKLQVFLNLAFYPLLVAFYPLLKKST